MSVQEHLCGPTRPRWSGSRVAVLAVRGPDAVDLLHRLCTQNLQPLRKPGVSTQALFATNLGKLVHKATLWSDAEKLYVAVPAGEGAAFVALLQRYTIVEDVTYEVVGEGVPCATLLWDAPAGPGHVAGQVPAGTVVSLPQGPSGPAFVLPAPRGLGAGVWVVGPALDAAALHGEVLPQLWHSFAPPGEPNAALGPQLSAEAWRYERLVAGVPAFGEDFVAGVMPFEHRLGVAALAWNKGCYVGQEVLSRLDSYNKVARLTMGVDVAPGGAAVLAQAVGDIKVVHDSKTVGRLSSWAAAPDEAAPAVALAVVKQAHATADTAVVLRGQDAAGLPLAEVAATLRDRPHWVGDKAAGIFA